MSSKQQIINKWLSQYAEAHSTKATSSSNQLFNNITLPLVRKVMAQTISNGDQELLEQAKIKAAAVNRDRKIDSILLDQEYEELKLEDTDEYKKYLDSSLVSVKPLSAPTGLLFYIDFKYDDKE